LCDRLGRSLLRARRGAPGAGAGLPTFLYVTLGTGLSSTFVLGGKPVAGRRGEAIGLGELGVSSSVDPGWTGNLEQFASGRGIGTRYSTRRLLATVGSDHVEQRAAALLEEHPERAGYLRKDRVSDVAVLADALRRIADGDCVIDPTIVSRLVLRRLSGPLEELTEREREGLGADGRGSLERGHRRAPVPQPAHRRDPHPPDLPQAGPARDAGLPPARCGRADVPAVQLSHLHRVLMVPVALARGKGFRAGSTLGPQTLAP
jgi:predicted NBD/HSP70 family sugar kinase